MPFKCHSVVAVIHEGCHELLGGSAHGPHLFARARIVAGNRLGTGEHHLRASLDFTDDRRDITPRVIRPRNLPHLLARFFVQRHEIRFAIMIAVDNEQVLINNRRTAKAMLAREPTRLHQPLLLAAEIIRRHQHLAGASAD